MSDDDFIARIMAAKKIMEDRNKGSVEILEGIDARLGAPAGLACGIALDIARYVTRISGLFALAPDPVFLALSEESAKLITRTIQAMSVLAAMTASKADAYDALGRDREELARTQEETEALLIKAVKDYIDAANRASDMLSKGG